MARQLATTITAGDTFRKVFDANPYTQTDGYSVSFYITGPSGSPQRSTFAATANTTGSNLFDIRIAPAVTANLAAGLYAYAVTASDGTDEYTVESGNITVAARADLSVNTDLRTHNQKVLDAINAVIEGRASQDQASYTIAGRTLTRTPLSDLMALQAHYKELVKQDEGSAQKKVFVRFTQA